AELEILDTHGDHDPLQEIRPVVTQADVQRMSAASRKVHVAPSLKAYLVELAQATRRSTHLALGISPRATLALQRVARARAASQGRGYVVPDDIKALAVPVLAHRPARAPRRGAGAGGAARGGGRVAPGHRGARPARVPPPPLAAPPGARRGGAPAAGVRAGGGGGGGGGGGPRWGGGGGGGGR